MSYQALCNIKYIGYLNSPNSVTLGQGPWLRLFGPGFLAQALWVRVRVKVRAIVRVVIFAGAIVVTFGIA